MGFEDPACARGTKEQILVKFRELRDQMEQAFQSFYKNNISS